MELTTFHFAGMAALGILVIGLGIYSGRRVYSASDFSVSGRRAGSWLVMGTVLGTLIGGASTVGTAQLAFIYGFSAWWFTLGGGIACLLIALFLVKPMRETGFETIPQFLSSSYGAAAGVIAALFVSLGIFINIVPQIFSSMSLLSSMFSIEGFMAAMVTVVMITLYVVFGGIWGTGLMGISKVLLTAVSLAAGGGLAFYLFGGAAGLAGSFPRYPWFSLFGCGVNTDLAAAFSLLVGVLSSQIYFQGAFSGHSLQAARRGMLLSALLGPAIGVCGIVIGLYMRANFPQIDPAQALPLFVIRFLPQWFAGVVLATLLLACVGTGAGLTLGMSTMLNRDIFQRLRPEAADKQILAMLRILIVLIMLLALGTVCFSAANPIILQWSYLSLGIRGATVCFPLLAAIFLKGSISPLSGRMAILMGPLTVILATMLPFKVNALYYGLFVSLVILLFGMAAGRERKVDRGRGSLN